MVAIGSAVVVLALLTVWAAAALYFDLPVAWLGLPAAILYVAGVIASAFLLHDRWAAGGIVALGFVLVLTWWLSLRPSNDANWQADVARRAWAEINGDRVTLHNLRNFDYRTEMDYIAHWETRTVKIANCVEWISSLPTGARLGSRIPSLVLTLAGAIMSLFLLKPASRLARVTPRCAASSANMV